MENELFPKEKLRLSNGRFASPKQKEWEFKIKESVKIKAKNVHLENKLKRAIAYISYFADRSREQKKYIKELEQQLQIYKKDAL